MTSARFLSLVVLAGAAALSGCDAFIPEDVASAPLDLTFQQDPTLAQRLVPTPGVAPALGKGSGMQLAEVGLVKPMTLKGKTLLANGIQYVGGKVYVSYITSGNDFGGGIDVLDPKNPLSPANAAAGTSVNFDVSAVAVSGTSVYVGGSARGGTYTGGLGTIKDEEGAVLIRSSTDMFSPTGFKFNNGDFVKYATGDVNGLSVSGSTIYASTADNGGAYAYTTTLTTARTPWSAAQMLSVHPAGANVYALTRTGLYVRSNTSNSAFTRIDLSFAPMGGGHVARLSSDATYLYVPLNRDGLAVVRLSDNKVVARVPAAGTFSAIASTGTHLFVANNDGGVVAYEWNTARTALTDVTRYFYDGQQSSLSAASNDLVFVEGYLYVAGASGGVRIFRATAS